MKEFAIVGFIKCGQTSLQKILPNGTRLLESTWQKNCIEDFENKFSDKIPVIIVRNPVDRIWSSFRGFEVFKEMTLEEFLKGKLWTDTRIGPEDPVTCSDYQKWIDPWLHLDPIVVKLETMLRREDFPHENKTRNYDTCLWAEMSDSDRQLITGELNKKGLLEKYKNLVELNESLV